MTELDQVHPFERAGFGTAPFRCVGHTTAIYRATPDAPAQPGAACDYCGTGIMDVYFVRSANSREFKVGSDCVRKVFQAHDATIPPDFRAEFARVAREKRDARSQAKREQVRRRADRAAELLDARSQLFTDQPHPFEHLARQGKTLRDYYDFVLRHGGNAGRTTVCRAIEKEAV